MGLIKWKQQDYLKLGQAVALFNRKRNKLESLQNSDYLPSTKDYYAEKENILTRKQLDRVINSLRRFSRENAENLYTTQQGDKMTNWEYKELRINERVELSRISREIKQLHTPIQDGFSRAQMRKSSCC